MAKVLKDNNTVANRISEDELINRACILQAKWNGTTIEEEYKKTMAYKQHRFNKVDNEIQNSQVPHMLPRHAKEACIYHNKFVKNNKTCCDGNECNYNCPNCVVRR